LQLMEHGLLLPLLRIVSDTNDAACAEQALRAILYLSSSVEQVTNQCVEELLQAKAVPRLIEFVLSGASSNKQLSYGLAILANLTRTEQGALELVGKTLPDEAVKEIDESKEKTRPTMELLLDRFLNRELITATPDYSAYEPYEWDTMDHDPYQHFAAIVMNATQLESGRNFALRIPKPKNRLDQPGKSVFETLLPQLSNVNPIRRRGISGMVRNCCLEVDAAWWILNVAKVVTPILYPLAGPEELDMDEKKNMDPDLWLQGPDKEREIDEATRQHLVEALLLLCATGRSARKTLVRAKTYVIMKYADMVEESETISERIEECVQYLARDEEVTEEGNSDSMVEELATRKKLKMLPSSQIGSHADVDYDDVD
jgi:hypothetical protein